MSPRSSRRAALALALSLALHLGLMALWASRPVVAPSSVAPRAVVDLEIRELSRPPTTPASPPFRVPSTSPTPATPAAPRRRHLATAAVAPAPAPTVPAVVMLDTGSVPREEHAAGSAPAPDLGAAGTRSVSKVAEAQLLVERQAPPPVDRSIQAPYQDPDANRRVAALIDADRGKRNVERGLVDPYFSELGHALIDGWVVPKEVERPIAERGFLPGIADNFIEMGRGWQQTAEEWAKTGTSSTVGVRPDDGRDEAQAAGDLLALTRTMDHRGALVVRLTQSRAGRLLDVELVSPSGNPEVDAAILRGLRSGATVLPVPPAAGMGIKDPIRSVWAFELSIKVCPPVPVLQGNFDIAAPFDPQLRSGVDVCVPLDRTVQKHVELLEVD